jgi:hypothetical protein
VREWADEKAFRGLSIEVLMLLSLTLN